MKKSIVKLGALVLLGSAMVVCAGMEGLEQDANVPPVRCAQVPDPCSTMCWGALAVVPLGVNAGNYQNANQTCGFCLWNFWVRCGPPETIPMEQNE